MRTIVVAAASLCLAATVTARTRVHPGINAFTVAQDRAIGREVASVIERTSPLLDDPVIDRYLDTLGRRIASRSRLPDLPYRFRALRSGEVESFALPGGEVFVSRGMLELVETEGELAGLLAHQIGHIAARHGTNQLTKRLLVAMPMSSLGGAILAGSGSFQARLKKLGVSIGPRSLMLRHEAKAETQADRLGVQQLVDAGFDPDGLARLFERMPTVPGRVPYLERHPAPPDRAVKIAAEIRGLPAVDAPIETPAQFGRMKSRLGVNPNPANAPPPIDSSEERRHTSSDRLFSIAIPDGWIAREADDRVRLTPEEGFGAQTTGRIEVRRLHLRSSRRERTLDDALNAALADLRQIERHLREVGSARAPTMIDDRDAMRTILAGRAPADERAELVSVTLTRAGRVERGDDYLVVLASAPEDEWAQLKPMLRRVAASLRQPEEPTPAGDGGWTTGGRP